MKFSNIMCSVILICATVLSEVESTPITSFLGRYAGEVWGGDMSDKINVMLKEAHKRPHIKKSPLESPNDVIELMKKRELMASYVIYGSTLKNFPKEASIMVARQLKIVSQINAFTISATRNMQHVFKKLAFLKD